MSRKVLAQKVQQGSGSVLAALAGAWVQSWAARPDPQIRWQDVGIGLGLAIAWLLRNSAK